MDLESVELSRERAVSSEPCSTRPNPFDGDEQFSRKRQRISGGSSRSRSVDVARARTAIRLSVTPEEDEEGLRKASPDPQTPTRPTPVTPTAEPTSSKVTINLRSNRPVEVSSLSPASPRTPSKMVEPGPGMRENLDSGDEAIPSQPHVSTPSSSSSAFADISTPEIELVSVNEDGSEFGNRSPPVAIIDDDDDLSIESDPLLDFPYRGIGETLAGTVRKIARFLEYGKTTSSRKLSLLTAKEPVDDEETFCRLRDWIDVYLQISGGHEGSWLETYVTEREFWDQIPDIIESLNRRR